MRGQSEKPGGTEAWHERVAVRYVCALVIAAVAAVIRLSLNPLLGMGLTIVRKAVERMGGAVGVESELGKGSRFWIELRKAP